MEKEEFEIFESKMNPKLNEETLKFSGPYSLQIQAIVNQLRQIDEISDKKQNSVLFHKLSKLFNLHIGEDLPVNCRKRGQLYSFSRTVKGKKYTIKGSHNLKEAIENYHQFCKEKNLKI